MTADDEADVPSGIDLRTVEDAHAWVAQAEHKGPWRRELRAAIAGRIRGAARVLELGGGPGLLAEAILDALPIEHYALLDFSPPMLELARTRLAGRTAAHTVLADFLDPDWPTAVAAAAPFDAIVSMQAAHELRHKRHLQRLYRAAAPLLRPGGVLVTCDHEPTDTARARALHATAAEQHAALAAAGFVEVATDFTTPQQYVVSGVRP